MAYGNGGTQHERYPLSGAGVPLTQPSPAVDTPSKVRDGLTFIEAQASELHELISAVERRIETILTPLPPATDVNQKQGGRPMMSHVFDRLTTLSETFTAAKMRLAALLDRVEL